MAARRLDCVIQGIVAYQNHPPMNSFLHRLTTGGLGSMVRRCGALLAVFLLPLVTLVCPAAVHAANWNADTLTVPQNAQGDTTLLTEAEVKSGRATFNQSCGSCHASGITKTNHNVGLDPETLALATPPRNSIESLVDYLHDPTSYDGEYSIADLHPSLRSSDIFPKMRDLSEDDLRLIAGYILVAPKIQGNSWGGGKIYF